MIESAAQGGAYSPFASTSWSILLVDDGGSDGLRAYHADIFNEDDLVWRMVLVERFRTQEVARACATERLRKWLGNHESHGLSRQRSR